MRILKYPLHLNGHEQPITVEGWMTPVAFQMQHGKPTLWAEVGGGGESTHRFKIIGTGFEVPPRWKHIGTVQDDEMVWHLYQAPVS